MREIELQPIFGKSKKIKLNPHLKEILLVLSFRSISLKGLEGTNLIFTIIARYFCMSVMSFSEHFIKNLKES